jgi:hypothetical protein
MKLSERLVIYECTGNMYPQQIMDAIKELEQDCKEWKGIAEMNSTSSQQLGDYANRALAVEQERDKWKAEAWKYKKAYYELRHMAD